MKERPLFPIYDILEHWQAFAYTTPEVRPHHHSLYSALVQMCKRAGGAQRFNLAYLDGMKASSIGSRNTYTAALRELEAWGFVTYTPGANGLKAPIVAVHFCASAEHQLSIWRASTYASADTSAEHIIKEVKRLKEDNDEKEAVVKNLEQEVADLKAELLALRAKPAPPNPVRELALATSDPEDEQHWSVGPLTKPAAFQAICERQGYEGIDYEFYRKQALAAAEDAGISRTIAQWNGWVRKYLNNQSQSGPLRKLAAGMPTVPTPKNELPPPGKERKGQVIAIQGVPHDESLNRMKVAAMQKHYPTAIIHAIR